MVAALLINQSPHVIFHFGERCGYSKKPFPEADPKSAWNHGLLHSGLRGCLKMGARIFSSPVGVRRCRGLRRFWHRKSGESYESLIFKTASQRALSPNGIEDGEQVRFLCVVQVNCR